MSSYKTISEILADNGFLHGPSPVNGMRCVWSESAYFGMFRAHEVLSKLSIEKTKLKAVALAQLKEEPK